MSFGRALGGDPQTVPIRSSEGSRATSEIRSPNLLNCGTGGTFILSFFFAFSGDRFPYSSYSRLMERPLFLLLSFLFRGGVKLRPLEKERDRERVRPLEREREREKDRERERE